MRIRFWGTRGSVPKTGPDTVRDGGNTSCVELRTAAGSMVIELTSTALRRAAAGVAPPTGSKALPGPIDRDVAVATDTAPAKVVAAAVHVDGSRLLPPHDAQALLHLVDVEKPAPMILQREYAGRGVLEPSDAVRGLDVGESPRETAFCAHAILDRAVLQVPDALHDDRFADNPLVTGSPRARFDAGAPLAAADGSLVGTLCLIDRRARRLEVPQLALLRDLADLVERELASRPATERQSLSTLSDI